MQPYSRTSATPITILTRMMLQQVVPRALLAAAKLGLDDLLRQGPKRAEELAAQTATDGPTMYRLIRALATLGVFVETDEGLFALGPIGECLRFATVLHLGEESSRSWDAFDFTLRTGHPAFDQVFGTDFFTYLAQHPCRNAVWNDWNTEMAKVQLAPVIEACRLDDARHMVDVGGGEGALLAQALGVHPTLRGTLYDLPQVVLNARALLADAGVLDRCEVAEGDMFASVPEGGDVYTVCRVLLNWDDERAGAILRNCRRAMEQRARLLVIDYVLPPIGQPGRMTALNDLLLLVMQGGKHRSEEEFRELLTSARFRLTSVTDTASGWNVLESTPS